MPLMREKYGEFGEIDHINVVVLFMLYSRLAITLSS
jgi:hypothetical protein